MMRLLLVALGFAVASADGKCKLLDMPADKPYPSLTQCYKDNQMACCVSAHDDTISDAYSSILSSTCLREFSYLEQYYCLGCNPKQPDFISGTSADGACGNATLHVCQSFANHLFSFTKDPEGRGSACTIDGKTEAHCIDGKKQYDKCGFKTDDNGASSPFLPSQKYADQREFLEAIRPPFFGKDSNTTADACSAGKWKGYKLVLDAADSTSCFSAASPLAHVSTLAVLLVALASVMNSH